MKKNYFKNILCILVVSTLLSCNNIFSSNGNIVEGEYPDRFLAEEYRIFDFKNGYPQGLGLRHDRGNAHPFNCTFNKYNVTIENGTMDLSLTENGASYAGSEAYSRSYTGFGFYAVSMKAAKCPGVISSFFIYKGNPWHEIDIEFLGSKYCNISAPQLKNLTFSRFSFSAFSPAVIITLSISSTPI